MENHEQNVLIYIRSDGHRPYRDWRETITDEATQGFIDGRLGRVRRGLFGDCKTVGKGVLELRLAIGPGYRIYLGRDGQTVVILLSGGDKSSQKRDIRMAQDYWQDYQRRKKQ